MLVDYHIHTKMCGHAQGEMEEYVQAALHKGFTEIGFSDHLPMYFRPLEERDPTITMKEEELPLYIERVKGLRRDYPQISIKLGIEADYVPGKEQILKEFLDQYSFDYVLGSIHFLDGWGFDDTRFLEVYQRWDMEELYQCYFKVLQGAAKSGLFDILAHPDLIKKFNYRPDKSLTELYEKTARIIKAGDLCIELNTAGLRYPAAEIYPAAEFLEICQNYKIPISLGSDAHRPVEVGADFDYGLKLIKEIGYREMAIFDRRQRKLAPLP